MLIFTDDNIPNGDVAIAAEESACAGVGTSTATAASSSSGTCPRPKKSVCVVRKCRETSSGGRRLSVDRRFLQQGRLERVMLHWNLRDATVTSDDWIGLYLLGEYSTPPAKKKC
jgi:hypothetical protein